ncbi:hypothetical protein OCOJLMKI_5177 [Methylobacterium iners]|uniref:Uncharacterized protein n=1 Tax=Methylobacterium iners TaxID=418707 RepID=A0ABQ4S812_9HYPH|nr:hypothetical protein OCOJLMKI_5177 [Methylobacterium iners]
MLSSSITSRLQASGFDEGLVLNVLVLASANRVAAEIPHGLQLHACPRFSRDLPRCADHECGIISSKAQKGSDVFVLKNLAAAGGLFLPLRRCSPQIG